MLDKGLCRRNFQNNDNMSRLNEINVLLYEQQVYRDMAPFQILLWQTQDRIRRPAVKSVPTHARHMAAMSYEVF